MKVILITILTLIISSCNGGTKVSTTTNTNSVVKSEKIMDEVGVGLYKVELDSNHCIVKGERKGRNLFDNIFTCGMSFISSLFLNQKLWDINAQPKIFHRDFMIHLKKAPYDFSLDLYILFVANRIKISIKSFPVFFSNREFGEAKGGGTLKGKFKLIKRTIGYIIELRNDIIKGNR